MGVGGGGGITSILLLHATIVAPVRVVEGEGARLFVRVGLAHTGGHSSGMPR